MSSQEGLSLATDGHTLALKFHPIVTLPNLQDAFQRYFNELNASEAELKTNFIVSRIVGKTMNEKGRGYLWVSNTKVYHALLGRNFDGSSRVYSYPDPTWEPPEEKELDFSVGGSWADIAEEEEEMVQPMIEAIREPLLEPPLINLTAEQTAKHPEEATYIQIDVVEPAYAHAVKADKSANVLVSSRLAPGMDENFIRQEFLPFSHSKKKYKGKFDFPFVKIVKKFNRKTGKEERIAYITFDEMTADASFAFFLRRVSIYDNHRTKERFTVYYTYAPRR